MHDATAAGDTAATVTRGQVRRGVRLGVDVGTVRIGVATSDPSGLIATPVETVARGRGDVARIAELARDHDALEVLVGLPGQLSGAEGSSAKDARTVAVALARAVAPVPVRLVDERLSTVSAERGLREAGMTGARARKGRRAVVDQAAAVVILQSALETERGSGRPPGEAVPAPTSRPPATGTTAPATGPTAPANTGGHA